MRLKLSDSTFAGLGFGTTSRVITTLGAIIGIYASTHDRAAILTAVITVSVADAFSDALGEHISEESKIYTSSENVKNITFSTFFSKLLVGLSFLIPFMFLNTFAAVIVSVLYGSLVLFLISFRIAKLSKQSSISVVSSHLIVAFCVIVVTYFLGNLIEKAFGTASM